MRKNSTVKKLRLASETLLSLDPKHLEHAAAGATTVTVYSCLPRCDSRTTCTTNFC